MSQRGPAQLGATRDSYNYASSSVRFSHSAAGHVLQPAPDPRHFSWCCDVVRFPRLCFAPPRDVERRMSLTEPLILVVPRKTKPETRRIEHIDQSEPEYRPSRYGSCIVTWEEDVARLRTRMWSSLRGRNVDSTVPSRH